MTVNEPECVAIKRRGAAHVNKLLAGKTPDEHLALLAKQDKAKSGHSTVPAAKATNADA